MDRNIALVIIFALCILGPVAVIIASSFASISSIGRNPSAAPKIFTAMIIALIFSAAISVIAILVAFQLFSPQSLV